MGVQKELGTYTNFEKSIFDGSDYNNTKVDTGIVTREADIASIEGEYYFAISISDCEGISQLYLYDVYFTGDNKEYNLNETSDTALEIKITTEKENDNQDEGQQDEKEDVKQDNTVADTEIPQTGGNSIVVLSIIIMIMVYSIILWKKFINYKEIK